MVLITGPTASGKSALALDLAERLGGEILSVDSSAVYRGLDVGSAKPTAADRRRVPHHLLDVADPYESYQLARFLEDARTALGQVARAGRLAILVGGTSMYATALVEGWTVPGGRPDAQGREAWIRRLEAEGAPALHRELMQIAPAIAEGLAPNDGVRILRSLERVQAGVGVAQGVDPARSLLPWIHAYALDVPPEVTRSRIDKRTDDAFLQALVRETVGVLKRCGSEAAPALRAVGYREALFYLRGRLSAREFRALVLRNTARLAKKQRTWWRRIAWVTHLAPDEALARIRADLDRGR